MPLSSSNGFSMSFPFLMLGFRSDPGSRGMVSRPCRPVQRVSPGLEPARAGAVRWGRQTPREASAGPPAGSGALREEVEQGVVDLVGAFQVAVVARVRHLHVPGA